MLEGFTSLIYCALLSSRSSIGTCASSRSTVKVIVNCMRGEHGNASNDTAHQNATGNQILRRGRRGAAPEPMPSMFAAGENSARRSDIEAFRRAVKRHPEFPKQPRAQCHSYTHHLSQSSLLLLANPRTLPIHLPVASVHSSARVPDTQSTHKTQALQDHQNDALDRFRSCMTLLDIHSGDLENAWEGFQAVRISDALPRLSDAELLSFASRAFDASCLSLHESRFPSKESAARLGRLHDELQRRVDGSVDPALQLWSDSLAVQTLIFAGKLDKAAQVVTEMFVLSDGWVLPQQITSLQQLFLASTRQHSLGDGMAVLARLWFWIRGYFNVPQSAPENMKPAIEELRRSVLFGLGTVKEASVFLQSTKDKAIQEVGTSIFAFVYGTQESADEIYATYHDFVTRGLSMPLEAHLRFFATLLSKGAYISAYTMRKRIRSQLPNQETAQELAAVLNLFPNLAKPGLPGQDGLDSEVRSTTRARFFSCIKDTASIRTDLFSVWGDAEASDILRRRNGDGSMQITDDDILAFTRLVVDKSRASLNDRDVPDATKFAHILDQALDILARRYAESLGIQDIENPFSRPLAWHSLTLKGDLHTVHDMLLKYRRTSVTMTSDYVRAMTQLFLAALRQNSLSETFEHYVVPLWPVIIRHLEDVGSRYEREMARASAELQKTIFSVFGSIENPGAWIAGVPMTPQVQRIAAHFFFVLFREQADSDRAWKVFADLQARRLPVSFEAYLVLLKTFIHGRAYEVANRVYDSLRADFPGRIEDPEMRHKDELHTALRLFSLQGDVVRAEECFKVMETRGFVDRGARRRLLHAYAVNGNTSHVHKLFYLFFPREDTSSSRPESRDFREVIYAHVRAGDLEGINHWLDEMAAADIRPDLSMYNMILLAFATSADLESASAVLARMYENDIRPNRISYTTVISIMADRKDPVAAEQLYQRALDEGVEPDDVMIMALMNAHVEAGSWRGVIRAFDYLQRSKRRSNLRTTQLYNTLLKAYVLIGAPFRVVFDIFRRFESLELEPTEHTYALLVQSACDSGRMDIARDLFMQLDAMATQGQGKSHVNAYVMTIIMAGFLRNGDERRAKAVYDDMQGRGIQPTSITFGVIIQSYANERSEESLRIAEDFMHSLLSAEESQRAWIGSARGGRPKALESVFGPLMSIYGRELDVTAVERQFDKMLEAGGQPTLVALTMLMDAYRRVNNLEGAQQIWRDIVEVALRSSQNNLFERLPSPSPSHSPPHTRGGLQRQANILCLSLSIYINALSAAGQHVEIATTWRQVKDWGFTFDAHNWNHLAVALIRAGEVERAFEIVERVLVPYQVQTRNFVRSRSKDPESPLTYVRPVADGVGEDETEEETVDTPRSPARPPSRRAQDVRNATRHQDGLSTVDEPDSDPAQPLHELQQISLTGQAWRTHNVTLDALSAAMKRLEAGARVLPTGQALRPEDDPRRMSPQEADEFYVRERREAGEVLGRIYQNYPNAVGLVERREMELQRVTAAGGYT